MIEQLIERIPEALVSRPFERAGLLVVDTSWRVVDDVYSPLLCDSIDATPNFDPENDHHLPAVVKNLLDFAMQRRGRFYVLSPNWVSASNFVPTEAEELGCYEALALRVSKGLLISTLPDTFTVRTPNRAMILIPPDDIQHIGIGAPLGGFGGIVFSHLIPNSSESFS